MKKVNISSIRSFLFSWCLLGIMELATAQHLVSTTETYSNQYSQERIYLHFDKSSYSQGETVWFKVYMMNATLHKPVLPCK